MGFRKSTASMSYFIQNLCVNIASQYSLSERMCVVFVGKTEKLKPALRAVLKTWSSYTSLVVSFVLYLFRKAYF